MDDSLSDLLSGGAGAFAGAARPDLLRTQSVDVPGGGRPKPHRFSFSRRGHEDSVSPQLSPASTPDGHHHYLNPLLALFHRDHHHHHRLHDSTIAEDLPTPPGGTPCSTKDRDFFAQLTDALSESPPVSRARSPSAFLPFKRSSVDYDGSRRYSAPSPEPGHHAHHSHQPHHRGLLHRLGSHDSPTNNRSINDLLRQLGRRVVGRSPTCTSPTPCAPHNATPRRTSGTNFLEVPLHGSPDDPGFRSRARSLDDGGARVRPRARPAVPSDCAATYHIYDEIIREGKTSQASHQYLNQLCQCTNIWMYFSDQY